MNDTDLLRRVSAADPAPERRPLDEPAYAALATILATPRPRRAWLRAGRSRGDAAGRGARVALAGVLAATAAVTAYVVVSPAPAPTESLVWPTSYPAATDPRTPLPYDPTGVPARPYLLALAERAERQPRLGPGRYHYIRTKTAGLGRKNLPSGGIGGFLITHDSTEWIGEHDGSGRLESYEVWGEGGEDVERLPSRRNGPQKPGTYSAEWHWAPIPADREALKARLDFQPDTPNRVSSGGESGQWLHLVHNVWLRKAVEPGESATLLRALADAPALVYRGGVTDRAGRRGVVVTFDSEVGGDMQRRAVMVLDRATGRMLAYEQEEHTAHGLPADWSAPATTSSELLLANARVDSTDARPS